MSANIISHPVLLIRNLEYMLICSDKYKFAATIVWYFWLLGVLMFTILRKAMIPDVGLCKVY